jgi:hypothetical protein
MSIRFAELWKKKSLGILIWFAISIPSISFAQTVGIEAGMGGNIQNGSFVAPCSCTFAHWTGFGFGGSAFIDLFTTTDFVFGINSGVQGQKVTDYEVIPVTLQRLANGDEQKTHLTYLTFGTYLRYTIPSTAIFLRVMPEVQYLLSSEFHHSEAMSEHRNTGKQTPMHSSSSDTDPVIDDLRSIRFAAKLSVGYDIAVSNFIVSPVFTYDLPLNTIRSNSTDDNWKISSLFFGALFRFNLNE